MPTTSAWWKSCWPTIARATRQLEQVVLRIGTILGATVRNQITDLFDKPRLLAIAGSESPFVFIWDQDVVAIILRAIGDGPAGIYNVAGDGALTLREIAARLGKRRLVLPAWLLKGALAVLKPLGLTQYGPEQLDFLRYRPVLLNTRLKTVFGYTPRYTSAEVFEIYREARAAEARPARRHDSANLRSAPRPGWPGGLRAAARAFMPA